MFRKILRMDGLWETQKCRQINDNLGMGLSVTWIIFILLLLIFPLLASWSSTVSLSLSLRLFLSPIFCYFIKSNASNIIIEDLSVSIIIYPFLLFIKWFRMEGSDINNNDNEKATHTQFSLNPLTNFQSISKRQIILNRLAKWQTTATYMVIFKSIKSAHLKVHIIEDN